MSRNTKTGVTIKKEFVKDKYLEYFLQKETEICYDELVDRVRRLSGEIIMDIYDVLKSGNDKKTNTPPSFTFGNPTPSFTFGNPRPSFTFNNPSPSFTFNNPSTFTFGKPHQSFTFNNPTPSFTLGNLKPSGTQINNMSNCNNTKTVNISSQFTVRTQTTSPLGQPSEHINKDRPEFTFEKTKKPLDTKVRKFSK